MNSTNITSYNSNGELISLEDIATTVNDIDTVLPSEAREYLNAEWKKGLNLYNYNNEAIINGGAFNNSTNYIFMYGGFCVTYVYLKAGTYTFSSTVSLYYQTTSSTPVNGTSLDAYGIYVSKNTLVTITLTSDKYLVICNKTSGEYTSLFDSLMVVKGTTAYPYQPYYGDIIHTVDVPFYFSTASTSPAETIGGTWTSLGSFTVGDNTVYAWKRV
jgi:hypothetical protein